MTSDSTTLRLVWPQWQGASPHMVHGLVPEMPLAQAQHGYAVGAAVLESVLPTHDGPTATVPVTLGAEGTGSRDGVDAKDAVLSQLVTVLNVIDKHADEAHRIITLGGECSVSVAPFPTLAQRYGDDLAIVWIDSHPDVGTPDSDYHGYAARHGAGLTNCVGRLALMDRGRFSQRGKMGLHDVLA